ncbi:myb family transcription factor EFM-like [Cornus florida]|uniref:myb family transcription factor EFM-like n=1 Tax=Cornus florida TaxID=4283 RepID=UPI0028A1A83A|nr:myb family transcription factor EFM-like [Cornus florida]
MMASPSELSLDCKPHGCSMLLKSFGDQGDQTQKLQDFLARLEEERLKIDAFKRELPLCMQLLTNAVEASRQQLQSYQAINHGAQPVLEEFMPLKQHSSSEEGSDHKESNMCDKANWMTSAQLWSQASDPHRHATKQQSSIITSPKETDQIGFSVSPKLDLDNKQRRGGAFLPFLKERNSSCPTPTLQALPDLALASPDKEMDNKKLSEAETGGSGAAIQQRNSEAQITTTATTTTTQTQRKARRCWSPELHRRFVNALNMLGGSQVATPKQIRELMKVDGLTNDEVKSHLQKYRLHTRRPSSSPQAAGTPTPRLVVLGGIWVPPEYTTAAHGGTPALYGSHQTTHASQHYCPQPAPQEFYPSPPQAHHQLHQLSLHHQFDMYKASSANHSSPESDVRDAENGSRSRDESKSESSSWKGDSASSENGGERIGLATLGGK